MAQRKPVTPEQARRYLRDHKAFLRRQLKMVETYRRVKVDGVQLGGPRSEGMEHIVDALERFLDESKPPLTLGQAFGVERKRGNPGGPGKYFDLAYNATCLRGLGLSWRKIRDHLELYDIDEDELRKVCDREKEAVYERFHDEYWERVKRKRTSNKGG
jgi:hypothetical protein